MTVYAHSRKCGDPRPWQELIDHLDRVADLAAAFAPPHLAALAKTAGRWHDIGKYQPEFQQYIGADPELSNENVSPRRVPHAAAGAALALDRLGETNESAMLALVIAAHHGALRPVRDLETVRDCGAPLLRSARGGGLPSTLEEEAPSFDGRPSALAVRMLFSALVDADLLDTEAWDCGVERAGTGEPLLVLRDRLDAVCRQKIAEAIASAETEDERKLAAMRRTVYESCISAADSDCGHFTLTVPTGGGKTLSGLAFALHHAVRNGMNRVIVVAPYTSILEQTADVYRKALGAENVVEHHSNISPSVDTDRNRQACENWDAPVIVTTSVQLFESLHAAHKRECRKLHRLANSVVLLDEVQTFPAALLQPIHSILKRLVDEFHVSVVHGTATQPLLATTPERRYRRILPDELRVQMQEIIPAPAALFDALRSRFRMESLGDLHTPLDPQVLVDDIREQHSALVITHRRDDARRLADMLGPECLHLSAAMCAAHRSSVLFEARRRLDERRPCTVVATQLVEAGVDIDFPVVYRALAGLDVLAQAAGRCNRAMKMQKAGRFVVYRAGTPGLDDEPVRDLQPPPGTPRLGIEVALSQYFSKGLPDLSDPALFPSYTAQVLSKCDTDRNGILEDEEKFDFEAVAANFRMIEEERISIVAPYGESPELVKELRYAGPSRARFRALQRYTVGVHNKLFETLYRAGWLEPVLEGEQALKETLWCVRVRNGESSPYDERFGFPNRDADVKLRPLQV